MRYLTVIVLVCVLALDVAAQQREPTRRDAELEEVLRLLEKSADLNPRDRTVYYYIFQVLSTQYGDRVECLGAFNERSEGSSPEAEKLRLEIERLEQRIVDVLERLGLPGDLLPGPVDPHPVPRPTSPDHPGR